MGWGRWQACEGCTESTAFPTLLLLVIWPSEKNMRSKDVLLPVPGYFWSITLQEALEEEEEEDCKKGHDVICLYTGWHRADVYAGKKE